MLGKTKEMANRAGTFSLSRLPSFMGIFGIGTALLVMAFLIGSFGICGTICCFFTPNIVAAAAFALFGFAILMFGTFIPSMWLRFGIALALFVIGVIIYTNPQLIGLGMVNAT